MLTGGVYIPSVKGCPVDLIIRDVISGPILKFMSKSSYPSFTPLNKKCTRVVDTGTEGELFQRYKRSFSERRNGYMYSSNTEIIMISAGF